MQPQQNKKKRLKQGKKKEIRLFPYELEIECEKELETSLLGVRNALNQNKNIIKNDKKKLTVYVTDSTGKKYFVKLPY